METVLTKLADGYSLKETAYALYTTPQVLKNVVLKFRTAKKARSTMQLLAMAMREGLIK